MCIHKFSYLTPKFTPSQNSHRHQQQALGGDEDKQAAYLAAAAARTTAQQTAPVTSSNGGGGHWGASDAAAAGISALAIGGPTAAAWGDAAAATYAEEGADDCGWGEAPAGPEEWEEVMQQQPAAAGRGRGRAAAAATAGRGRGRGAGGRGAKVWRGFWLLEFKPPHVTPPPLRLSLYIYTHIDPPPHTQTHPPNPQPQDDGPKFSSNSKHLMVVLRNTQSLAGLREQVAKREGDLNAACVATALAQVGVWHAWRERGACGRVGFFCSRRGCCRRGKLPSIPPRPTAAIRNRPLTAPQPPPNRPPTAS